MKVTRRGQKPFFGMVYSQYHQTPMMRRICVEGFPSGAGIGYPVMFVEHVKRPTPRMVQARDALVEKNKRGSW